MESNEIAILGGGCFWCLDAVFTRVKGVIKVVPGYMGGASQNPTYEAVCSGLTGHVEVVQVVFSPASITFSDLLRIFFTIHDPTTPNRQGADVGSQYRSQIFTTSDVQIEDSRAVVTALEADGIWDSPIVTDVRPAEIFYVAENYHHQYYEANRSQPYCHYVIDPKVAKLQKSWEMFLK